MNNTCDSVSVSLVTYISLCEVSWVRLHMHQQMCLAAQAKGGWDKYDVQMAYEEDEYLTSQALRIPDCVTKKGTKKGWSKERCQNKKSGSGLCKPRWFGVRIKHYNFRDALQKVGIPVVGDCKNLVMVYAMNKEESKHRVNALASAMHYRVWEGIDWDDDWSFKLAIKPEYI